MVHNDMLADTEKVYDEVLKVQATILEMQEREREMLRHLNPKGPAAECLRDLYKELKNCRHCLKGVTMLALHSQMQLIDAIREERGEFDGAYDGGVTNAPVLPEGDDNPQMQESAPEKAHRTSRIRRKREPIGYKVG